jgi:hypothetical protein
MPLAEMAITVITGRRTRSSSLTPPRSTGGALGGILGLPFAPAADRQQQGGLTPIGFCLGGFLGAAPTRFETGASCAKLRLNAAIRSMIGGGAAISLGLTVTPFILASISSRKASW